jgi:hypothetical protein
LQIRTTITQGGGAAAELSAAAAGQLKDPLLLALSLPKKPRMPAGWVPLSGGAMPADLKVKDGLMTLRRSRTAPTKLGAESGSVLWIGPRTMLKIDAPRSRDALVTYPEQGSSMRISTDVATPSVLVEALGPLKKVGRGETVTSSVLYKLLKRTVPDPLAEARKALGR